MLLIAFYESLIECLLMVCLPITITVLGVDHARCSRDEQTGTPNFDTIGIRQMIEEQRGHVIASISVRVP